MGSTILSIASALTLITYKEAQINANAARNKAKMAKTWKYLSENFGLDAMAIMVL